MLALRRAAALALPVVLVPLVLCATAQASRMVTWKVPSRFVSPTDVRFNPPPPGAPARSDALRVNVLLPDGYDGVRRYPVLYLLHGIEGGFDQWANPSRGDIAALARHLDAIIVMPDGARGLYLNWWHDGARGKPAWERYYLDELIPLVERRLKVRSGRRWHAIAGVSMGGYGAFDLAAERLGYFGSAVSFSGQIAIQIPNIDTLLGAVGIDAIAALGDPNSNSFYWTGHDPAALVENLRYTRLYVTAGDGTGDKPPSPESAFPPALAQTIEVVSRRMADVFVAAARDAHVAVTFVPKTGVHDWPYFRPMFREAVRWGLFKPVVDTPRSWTYRTAATSGQVYGLRYSFAAPPAALLTLERHGDRLIGKGTGRLTIIDPGGTRLDETLPFRASLKRAHR